MIIESQKMYDLVENQVVNERKDLEGIKPTETLLNTRKICFDIPQDDCLLQNTVNSKIDNQRKVFSKINKSRGANLYALFQVFLTSVCFLFVLFMLKNASSVSAQDSAGMMPDFLSNSSNSSLKNNQCGTVLTDKKQLKELKDNTSNVIYYKNKDHLNEMSFITDKTITGKDNLVKYSISALPQAVSFIDKMEKEIAASKSNEGKKVTQSGPGFKVTQYTQIPYN